MMPSAIMPLQRFSSSAISWAQDSYLLDITAILLDDRTKTVERTVVYAHSD